MKKLDWDDLRFFLAVAAAGSLSAAARALDVNTTTVLRRIANLEESCGTRLFERLRVGYKLTPAGAQFLERLEPVDSRLSSLLRDFHAETGDYRGVVRLGASDMLASQLLMPSMADFQAQHPDIGVDIVADAHPLGGRDALHQTRVVHNERDVDLALRLARPIQGDMLVRKLADIAYGLYASPAYLKQYGKPEVGDLAGHKIIGFAADDRPLGPVWWLNRAERNGEVVMRAGAASVRCAAAQAGIGIVALPLFYGKLYEKIGKIGQLTPICGADVVGTLELWLLARNDMAKLAHIRAVMDFTIATIHAQTSILATGL